MALSILVSCFSSPSSAQQPNVPRAIRNAIQASRRGNPQEHGPAVLIEPPAPIVNLFARAQDGIARADWKFAIDCLQRIIDDPQGALMPTMSTRTSSGEGDEDDEGGVLYDTARRRAIRRIASLPPEGFRAYRLLYDGKAKRLYEAGQTSHDPAPLRTIVERYPLSSYGEDAADLLASWALDAGRAGEAVMRLTDGIELLPQGQSPGPLIVSKLAAAYTMLGRLEEATTVLSLYSTREGKAATPQDRTPSQGKPARRGEPASDRVVDADTLHSLQPTGFDSSWAKPTLQGDTAPLQGADGKASTVLPQWSWPMGGGPFHRQGRMPPVDPMLVKPVPWRFELPDSATDAWRRVFALADDPGGPLLLPVGQLAAKGRRLFARTLHGCVALDMDDLSLLWESVEPGSGIAPGDASPASRRNTTVPAPFLQRGVTGRRDGMSATRSSYEDYVTGNLTLGEGLVLTVSRGGRGDYTHAAQDRITEAHLAPVPVSGPGNIAPLQGITAPPQGVTVQSVRGTRIIAYDDQTGQLRWQRGRTGHPDDPLGDADFRSAPIAVDHLLWVPYLRHNALYVAVLNPEDGSLQHNILLCSIAWPMPPRGLALPPTHADGVLYVPSGKGVLFAVDVHDFTLRWASRYTAHPDEPPDHPTRARQTRQERNNPLQEGYAPEWLCSAPVVAGGLVLLTPTESHKLFAFWAATGELHWSTSCDDCAYIIGADYDRVWLGGRTISCASLIDGQELWSVNVPSTPTGRAVLVGAVVDVPVLEGLLSLDSATGEFLSYETSIASDKPLGNLLGLDAALFVCNPSCIRKFPDIKRSYPLALAQYESHPTDPASAIRLAWLKLLQDQPQGAYEIADAIATSLSDRNWERFGEVAHLQVESLLALAREAADSPNAGQQVIALLQQAHRTARSSWDKLQCGLAMGDQLTALNRPTEAYRQLWGLGLSLQGDTAPPPGDTAPPPGGQMVKWGDQVEAPARFVIAQRLGRIESRLSDQQRRQLMASREEGDTAPLQGVFPHQVTKAPVDLTTSGLLAEDTPSSQADSAAITHLRAVIDLDSYGEMGQRARMQLASYHEQRVHYEQAEQLLRRFLYVNPPSPLARIGLFRLALLYAEATTAGVDSSAELLSLLQEMETRFPGQAVPKQAVDATAPQGRAGSTETLAHWVDRLRRGVAPEQRLAYERMTGNTAIELTGDPVWSIDWPPRSIPLRIVGFGEHRPLALAQRVVLMGPNDVVTCYDAAQGDILWEAALRLSESFSSDAMVRRGGQVSLARRAVADGQTAVFSGDEGLFAIGLATGRRIWERPYQLAGEVNVPTNRDRLMAVEDGLLAAMPNAGRLTLMRMIDGETLWQRDLRDEPVDRIWMKQGIVVTADAKLRRVGLFDRNDGRLIKRIYFSQPDTAGRLVNLVLLDGLLIGPSSSAGEEGLQAIDIHSGEPVWHRKLDKPLVQLFPLGRGYVGMGLLGGDVRIAKAASGETLPERHLSGTQQVLGGALIDGTLVVQHTATRSASSHQQLAALDVATGEQLWRRDDVISLSRTGEPLPILGGLIPAVIVPPAGSKQARKWELTMINIRTGRNVGAKVSPGSAKGMARLFGDFEVHRASKVLVLGTERAVHGLRIETFAGRTN